MNRAVSERVVMNADKITEILDLLAWKLDAISEAADVARKLVTDAVQGRPVTRVTAEKIRVALERALREKKKDPAFSLSLDELLQPELPSPPLPEVPAPGRIRWIYWAVPLTLLASVAVFLWLWRVQPHESARPSTRENDTTPLSTAIPPPTASPTARESHISSPSPNAKVNEIDQICLSEPVDGRRYYIIVKAAVTGVMYSFGPLEKGCASVYFGRGQDKGLEYMVQVVASKLEFRTGEIRAEDLPTERYEPITVTRR